MQPSFPFRFKRIPSLSFALMIAFLGVLWFAGGASRADVSGQVAVRGAAWLIVAILCLAGNRPSLHKAWPVGAMVAAALVIVLLQLIPLPPGIWHALPHRNMFAINLFDDGGHIWRPLSIVPGATWNAASSLIVPVTMLALLAGLTPSERDHLPGILLGLVTASMLIGLIQFSGVSLFNPFINATRGEVSGSFANRNHFALFLAMGCVLAPIWAFRDGRQSVWRGPVALGLVLLFALVILASGSRAGMILGVLAIGIGLMLAFQPLRRQLRTAPRWILPGLLVAVVATIGAFVFLSIASDRAASINRAVTIEGNEDMRVRALPTVWSMVQTYFPAGTGFGSFDPIFRIHEPFGLLKLTYFNHAHNDFLEIVLDGGLLSLTLLAIAVGWWLMTSLRAWRETGSHAMAPKLGSALIALILVASVFDYPARTPTIMAVIIVAAVWLAQGPNAFTRSALPNEKQRL